MSVRCACLNFDGKGKEKEKRKAKKRIMIHIISYASSVHHRHFLFSSRLTQTSNAFLFSLLVAVAWHHHRISLDFGWMTFWEKENEWMNAINSLKFKFKSTLVDCVAFAFLSHSTLSSLPFCSSFYPRVYSVIIIQFGTSVGCGWSAVYCMGY